MIFKFSENCLKAIESHENQKLPENCLRSNDFQVPRKLTESPCICHHCTIAPAGNGLEAEILYVLCAFEGGLAITTIKALVTAGPNFLHNVKKFCVTHEYCEIRV